MVTGLEEGKFVKLILKIDPVLHPAHAERFGIYIYIYIYIYIGWNDKIVALEKTTWFHFRLTKTGFLFLLQTIYLSASCVQFPRAIGAFYHVWKWHNVQRARSEMRRCTTNSLYRFKLWQQGHCQHPQNANPDGSTLEGTAQRIGRAFRDGGAEGHRQEDPDQGVHREGPGNHWWNTPAAYSADCQRFRRFTNNCECMCAGGPEVLVLQAPDKPYLDWDDKEPQANQVRQSPLLPRPEPAGLLRLVIRRKHHQHDLPQHQSQPDRCHLLSIRRPPAALVEKACSQFQIRIEAVTEAEGGYIE